MPETKTNQSASEPVSENHDVFMEWVCPAYLQPEKSLGWYLLMGCIVLGFVLYGLMSVSGSYGWIVSITFLLMAGVYYFSQLTQAPVVRVEITDHGIRFGAKFFSYGDIKSFWILEEEDIKSLNFRTARGASRTVSIFIPIEMNRARLREYLVNYLVEEEGKRENFSDQLIRNLGL